MAEPRVEHGRHDVPAERLSKPEATRGGSLQHDPGESHQRE